MTWQCHKCIPKYIQQKHIFLPRTIASTPIKQRRTSMQQEDESTTESGSEEEEEEETASEETGSEEESESDYDDESEEEDIADRYGQMGNNTRTNAHDDDFNYDEEEEEDTTTNKTVLTQQRPQLSSSHNLNRVGSATQNTNNNSSNALNRTSSTLSNSQRVTSASQRVTSASQRVTSANRVGSARSTVVKNQPFDEVIETFDEDSDSESVPSEDGTPRLDETQRSAHGTTRMNSAKAPSEQSKPIETTTAATVKPLVVARTVNMAMERSDSESDGDTEDETDEEESDSEEDDDMGKSLEYNPKDYEQLPVSAEIKQLFAYVAAYKPHEIDLNTKLKPFVPDYIPAVGELDPFLKAPRPDGKPDFLGLKVLDEPAAKQSDPTVVTLNLSYRDVKSTKAVTIINSVEQADKNPKKIQKWIDDIRELHKSNPPPTVNYSKSMPDINALMQAWPDHFEDLLQTIELPSADIDLDLEEYVRVVCTILDIPVYTNAIESLHLLFSLYLEFKSNQHFSQQMEL
jgi:intraflagellar transport protein 46